MARGGTSSICVLYVNKKPAMCKVEMRYAPKDWESVSSKGLYFIKEYTFVV